MKYPNPFILNRADPFLLHHEDGNYYFTATEPNYNFIELRISATLYGLRNCAVQKIWTHHAEGTMSHLIWAPEIHYIDNRWFIYFAAAPTEKIHPIDDTFQHRIFVLAADNPHGPWQEKGQLDTGLDTFCLDATVFTLNGDLYCVWAQKDRHIRGNSNLYIARMKNPWTLESPPIMLSKPEFLWECSVIPVNEGPAVFIHGKRIFITYSANATGAEYCMGMLSAYKDTDLLNPQSWKKSMRPVFQSSSKNKKYGPGHNSFSTAEDGKTPLVVYHVRDLEKLEEDPLQNPNRHTCIQPFSFDENEYPVFGEPEASSD